MIAFNTPFDRFLAAVLLDTELVSPLTLASPTLVAEVRIPIEPLLTSRVEQEVRAVIYNAGAGLPTTLVAVSNPITVFGNAEVSGAFPLAVPLTLPAGRYWVGLHAGRVSSGFEPLISVGVVDNAGQPPLNGALALPRNYADGAIATWPAGGFATSSSALSITLSETVSAVVAPGAGAATETLIWPKATTTAREVMGEVRDKLNDAQGLLMADDELFLIFNDTLRSAAPTYMEVRELAWDFAGDTLPFPLQVEVDSRYADDDPLVVRWIYESFYGVPHSLVITKYRLEGTTLTLPEIFSFAAPDTVQLKAAFLVAPKPAATMDTLVGVSYRWLVEGTFIRAARKISKRSGVDYMFDIQDAQLVSQGEAMRSGGSPTVTNDGRIV